MDHEYLWITPASLTGREDAKAITGAIDGDLLLPFWGQDEIRKTCDLVRLLAKERMSLHQGERLTKYVNRSLLQEWVSSQKEARGHREHVIRQIEEVEIALHKLFLRDKRWGKEAQNRVESGIIPYMDGSTVLWLNVVLVAKKDFLRLHVDPRRIPEWENLKSHSLLDEDGSIRSGMEDAWNYITARDFLFDDEYCIDLDEPEAKELGRAVTLGQLLGWLVETCKGQSVDSSFVNPSISHLRAQIARATGDPKLIQVYSARENEPEED